MRVAFRKFIELADLNSIKNIITTASSSSKGKDLKLLWGRTFKEGLIAGHQLQGKMEERVKEVQAEAYEEGYQAGYEEGQHDEHGDWALEGHGMHCSHQITIPYDDYGTPPTTTMSVSTQTSPYIARTNSLATSTTQTDPLVITTASIAIQTSPTMFTTMSQVPSANWGLSV